MCLSRAAAAVISVATLCALTQTARADIYVINDLINATVTSMEDAPSAFGPGVGSSGLSGALMVSRPLTACTPLNVTPPDSERAWLVLIQRGDCTFMQKVLHAQQAGFTAAIVFNVGSDAVTPMHGDGSRSISIPSFFVGQSNGEQLMHFTNASQYHVRVTNGYPFDFADYLVPFAIVIAVCFVVLVGIMMYRCYADHRRLTRHRLPKRVLDSLPTARFDKTVHTYETCAICLDDYEDGEQLRVLPCNHAYHSRCVDPWLTRSRRVCPVCKQRVRLEAGGEDSSDSESGGGETEPLIPPRRRPGYGATGRAAGRPPRPSRRAARPPRSRARHAAAANQPGPSQPAADPAQTDPSQTDEPAEPSGPAPTGEPTQGGRPAQSRRPAQPADAAQADEPAETNRPAQTDEPTQTDESAQANRPAQTDESAQSAGSSRSEAAARRGGPPAAARGRRHRASAAEPVVVVVSRDDRDDDLPV